MICNIDKLYGTIVVITNNLEINKHGNKHLIEFPQEKVYIKRDPISLLVDHEQIIHSFKIKLTIISIYQSISIALFTTESFKINCSILPSEERIKCLHKMVNLLNSYQMVGKIRARQKFEGKV